MLEVRGLEAWYGESHVLHGVDFDVAEGEVVTLLGRNGAGKTTTMKSIMGLVAHRRGSIRFQGSETIGLRPDLIARLGIALCPEERGIFASLSVSENLMLPPVIAPGGLDVATIHTLFPNLKERASSQGTKLSGGEQQMLAMARAVMGRPRLLMLDEPSMGLAPLVVAEIYKQVQAMREQGVTILLVEQNAKIALKNSDRALIIASGEIRYQATSAALLKDGTVAGLVLGH